MKRKALGKKKSLLSKVNERETKKASLFFFFLKEILKNLEYTYFFTFNLTTLKLTISYDIIDCT